MDFNSLGKDFIEGIKSPFVLAAIIVVFLTVVVRWIFWRNPTTVNSGNAYHGDYTSGAGAVNAKGNTGEIKTNCPSLKFGNHHHGDNISGTGAGWKVQGNVIQPNIGGVPDNQSQGQASTSSEIRSGSENAQASRDEAVPPTSDLENFVKTILSEHPDEDKKNVVTCLGTLGIYEVKELAEAKVPELVKIGIKLVQAKLLLRCYKDYLSETQQ